MQSFQLLRIRIAWDSFSVIFTLVVIDSLNVLFLLSTVVNIFPLLFPIMIASLSFQPISVGLVKSDVVFVMIDWFSYCGLRFCDGDGCKLVF